MHISHFFIVFITLFVRDQCNAYSLNQPRISKWTTSSFPSTSRLHMSTIVETSEAIKKWYLINYKKRPDITISDSSVTLTDIMTDVWKAILISIRTLEKDEEMKEYVSVISFPNLVTSPDTLSTVSTLCADTDLQMVESSPLFQDNFGRVIRAMMGPSNIMLIAIETARKNPRLIDFEDADQYVPTASEVLTNEIESFPFPSIYDFISEINRPPDPITTTNLRFKYAVKDLKYDVEKMKKKKNPQEVVDSINSKLTRLANWRDVLTKVDEDTPDPFIESAEWGERIKLKYQSLKALAGDPKKALDTQYDKRKTFVKIIDKWSDRLKRAFKFIYQSQRPPEDFKTPIIKSKWRNEIVNVTKLFSQVAFLDLKGPDFVIGSPAPLFDQNRYLLWESDYPPEVAAYEMLAWFREMELIGPPLADSIAQHTYSRGFITERVLYDFWNGLSRFIASSSSFSSPSSSSASRIAPFTAKALLDSVEVSAPSKVLPNDVVSGGDHDHTEEFMKTLHALDQYTRSASFDSAKPVKEMYRDWFFEGKELVDWWTTLVRDLDLIEEVHNAGNGRTRLWSDIMAEIVLNELENDTISDEDPGKVEYANKAINKWLGLKTVMQQAEKIEALLPWKTRTETTFDITKLAGLADHFDFKAETVHLDFQSNNDEKSYLFVAPRYFRGIGLDEELTAYLQFCQIVLTQLKPIMASMGKNFKMKVLHPQLIDQKGVPVFTGRAPHPAIVITIVK